MTRTLLLAVSLTLSFTANSEIVTKTFGGTAFGVPVEGLFTYDTQFLVNGDESITRDRVLSPSSGRFPVATGFTVQLQVFGPFNGQVFDEFNDFSTRPFVTFQNFTPARFEYDLTDNANGVSFPPGVLEPFEFAWFFDGQLTPTPGATKDFFADFSNSVVIIPVPAAIWLFAGGLPLALRTARPRRYE